MAHSDGKRPDGTSVMPWKCGRTLFWDATCTDTFAPSHVALAAREAGLVASQAEQTMTLKYAHLNSITLSQWLSKLQGSSGQRP